MNRFNRIVLIFALIKFSIAFLFIHHDFELQRDEYLYLADGGHLAWGFIEMPPALALLGRISMLLGGSFYAVYFWGALFGALTVVLIGEIVKALGGKEYALFIACLAFLVSGFLRMHILFQPNFLDVFFWTLSCYYIIRWICTSETKYLYFIGICFGIGMLSKYTMAFFIISYWASVVLTRQRALLRSRHFYFSMLIALAIALPNIIWQMAHQFPVAHHMKLLQKQQLQYLSRIGFLLDQIIITLPCFFVWLAGLWYVFLTREGRKFISIGTLYLAIIVLLEIFKGKNYYAMSIYPALLAIGAVHLEKRFATKSFFRIAIRVVILSLGIPFFPLTLPFASPGTLEKIYQGTGAGKLGALKWEDGQNHPLPQDFADMLGWREMTLKVSAAWNKLDSNEKAHTLLFCDNYGEAGAVNYFGRKYHLPQAYSDNASFLYWFPEKQHIDNILLVTDDKEEMRHEFIKEFRSAELTDSITNPYAREKGSLIILLKGANERFNDMFRQKIQADKEALK